MKETLNVYYAKVPNMGDLLNVMIIEQLFGYMIAETEVVDLVRTVLLLELQTRLEHPPYPRTVAHRAADLTVHQFHNRPPAVVFF